MNLLESSRAGDLERCKSILDNGVNVNSVGKNQWSALHYSAMNGHLDVSNLLIHSGADVNAQTKHHWSPLHCACGAIRNTFANAVVQLLLDHGADYHIEDDLGQTPLHCAALNGNTESIVMLLDKGADINNTTNHGWTPLMCAVALQNHEAVVDLLISRGALLELENNDGKTAFDLACAHGSQKLINVLANSEHINNHVSIADEGWMKETRPNNPKRETWLHDIKHSFENFRVRSRSGSDAKLPEKLNHSNSELSQLPVEQHQSDIINHGHDGIRKPIPNLLHSKQASENGSIGSNGSRKPTFQAPKVVVPPSPAYPTYAINLDHQKHLNLVCETFPQAWKFWVDNCFDADPVPKEEFMLALKYYLKKNHTSVSSFEDMDKMTFISPRTFKILLNGPLEHVFASTY